MSGGAGKITIRGYARLTVRWRTCSDWPFMICPVCDQWVPIHPLTGQAAGHLPSVRGRRCSGSGEFPMDQYIHVEVES